MKDKIQHILEATFDIPFSVEELSVNPEPYFIVSPAGNDERLFNIHIRFQNRIRMEMSFEPQKYGSQMVMQMGNADSAHKKMFCSYAKQLSCNVSKITMKINEIPHDPANFENWPDEWNKIFFKVDVRPIEFYSNNTPDYSLTISKWLPIMVGLSLSLLNVVKIEDEEESSYHSEGQKYEVTTTRYERNPINRILCIAHYGYDCQICGMNFEDQYGELGRNFIHVHHTTPVSQMGDDYHVDPIHEMIPVCPNCHAMLHRTTPPLNPETLREIIRSKYSPAKK